MKLLIITALAALSALAADAPTPAPETAPVITAADREPLHEAQEALQTDQSQTLLGQAAALRLADRQKAVEAAGRDITAKCGSWGVLRDEAGRVQCGKTKAPETAAKAK